MQLTPDTLEVLQNFANINQNLMVREGEELLTISPTKATVAAAKLSQGFDRSFGIYNLPKFLACLNLIGGEADVTLGEKAAILKGQGSSLKFFYTDEQMLQSIKGAPKMPEPVLRFTLTQQELDQLRKACNILGHKLIQFAPAPSGQIAATVLDLKDETANTFSLELNTTTYEPAQFAFIFDVGNLSFLPGDYEVAMAERAIASFTNKGRPVTYWVALAKESFYNKE